MKKCLILLLCLFTTDSFATGMGNVSSAPCDNDTLNKYTGTANVEINWEPNTINLNWYDGDEKLTVANNAQSCVYDGAITVPAAPPQKLGYTFNGWKVIRVPGGFTELEYIESSRTQYIDTGIIPTLDYSIEVKAVKDMAFSLFGADNLYNLTGVYVNFFYLGKSGVDNRIFYPDTINNSLVHIWGYNAQHRQIYCDDIIVDVVVGATAPAMNLYLFARNRPTEPDSGAHKIYYAKLWDETRQLIFNGIPARRNSDGVLGMYDTITNQFFTNAGTGDFIAGPAVQ